MYMPSEEEIRHRRNVYLQKTDVYVLPDRWDTYSEDEKTIWREYRKALRDMPSQEGWPSVGQFSWPTAPINLNIEAPEEWPPELI